MPTRADISIHIYLNEDNPREVVGCSVMAGSVEQGWSLGQGSWGETGKVARSKEADFPVLNLRPWKFVDGGRIVDD